jgi:hypothetical protein
VADFNGDEFLDIATTNNGSSTVSVLIGDGNGSFSSASNFPTLEGIPSAILAEDLNDDGAVDLILSSFQSIPSPITRGRVR